MNKIKIAFLDTVGLTYTGDTLTRRGLGGSESAVIYLTKELVKLNFDVTVFNKCEKEGIYDGVLFQSLDKCPNNKESYDILISSRSCLPFLPIELKEDALKSGWHYNLDLTYNIVMNSKVKIIWLHDTFCSGDPWLESLIVRGQIDEIFTLSDWHSNYIMNGHRWRGRYFEALKRKVWQTRNGINSYINEVDISKKDPNQFVFCSAV